MKKGDILVAYDTSPEMMSGITIASGIITSKMGINTHAAIIAKELDIPCLIGCENATRVIKNGDIIKVENDKVLKNE